MIKGEKIQKVLARSGYGSRREIERWIAAGRLKVNDRVAVLGDRVLHEDKLYLDGVLCGCSAQPKSPRILIYHKPLGVVCTRMDPQGRPTVFEQLPELPQGRWIGVGRLDINTTGLLLFTNDGELAHRLLHPSSKIEREYVVRVLGACTPEVMDRLKTGALLEDGMAHFESVVEAGGDGVNRWFHVVVAEGRNRLVRRLWESQGFQVSRLKRVRFGSVVLPRALKQGAWMELLPAQVMRLVAMPTVVSEKIA